MQKIINLIDSDDNPIMALVEYNPDYIRDCKVVYAVVELKATGEKSHISNSDVIKFQYYEEIIKQLQEG